MINQMRTFLLLALLGLGYLLVLTWQKDYSPPSLAPRISSVSGKTGKPSVAMNAVPVAPTQTTVGSPIVADSITGSRSGKADYKSNEAEARSRQITITTDVLRLTVDTRGGSIVSAELLNYPVAPRTPRRPSPAPIHLLSSSDNHYFIAQSGLVSAHQPAPDHRALFHVDKTRFRLAKGVDALDVNLTWSDPSGIKVVKRYVLHRGSYVVHVDQHIENHSSKTWHGNAYRQMQRMNPPRAHANHFLERISNPSRYSFFGAAWYSPDHKFTKLAFDKFGEDPLQVTVKSGWIAMVQHYFVGAWIPDASTINTFSTAILGSGNSARYLIRSMGPGINLDPGQQSDSRARLYLGPKLPVALRAAAPGLPLTVNYGMLKVVAVPLHWILAQLARITHNWGVAIILLVLLINLATHKLTNAQYLSAARMRKLKPRMDALKERYGADRRKMQEATMELYKKEKINPLAGCLPMLVTFPIFWGLYFVLRDSVELRQAPFFGWIHDLSAADPYLVLPILNAGIMLLQQLLMPPTAGMDPTQAKMMKFMPLIFAVIFLFFPAGLCLYYVVNGICRLGQQWWVMRRFEARHTAIKPA